MISINDNESIKLFLSFYQLLFLGSPFAEKILHIKFEEPKKKGEQKTMVEIEGMDEVKSDSGASFIIDTSEISSQSDGGSGL